MKYSPILFSTPMVQAIQRDIKTQTRRVIKGAGNDWQFLSLDDNAVLTAVDKNGDEIPKEVDGLWASFESEGWPQFPMVKARYCPGDILWVRETWTTLCRTDERGVTHYDEPFYLYAADDDQRIKWRPSIHMPKSAARAFLRVTDARVEHIQDISYDNGDIWAEGIPAAHDRDAEEKQFIELWDSINKKRGYGWDCNPWVWAYIFERVDKPTGWPERRVS